MGTYISEDSVRRTVGIDTSEIDADDVNDTISEVEKQVPNKFNTVFLPTSRIDTLDGDGTNRLLLDMNPVLAVRKMRIDGTAYDTDTLEIYKESGYIFLGQTANTSSFPAKKNIVSIKYLFGTVEYSSVSTETDAASVAGTGIVLSVDSSTDFTVGDWIEIHGMDGNKEVAQITAKDTGEITVDQLIFTHEDESEVFKLQVDSDFTKYMNLVAGIALVARIIGQSYKDTVGYDLGELHVQKGEPYTQWREAANQLIRERDFLSKTLTIRPRVVS